MDQNVLNIIFGVTSAIAGWFVRVLWEADKELRSDLAKLREEIPKEYVSKTDIEKRFDRIEATLQLIWEDLKSKADKH
jgi:hypothetical protein